MLRDKLRTLARKVVHQVQDITSEGFEDGIIDTTQGVSDLVQSHHKPPRIEPSQTGLPEYVTCGSDPSMPIPGALEYSTAYVAFLPADQACLQTMLDRYLTKPCGGEWTFHPLAVPGMQPLVSFVIQECFLTARGGDQHLGWGRYSEATLVVPTWIEPHDKLLQEHGVPPLQFFMPHIWVSLAPGMASGRESWGYRKTIADVHPPIPSPVGVNNFEIFTLAQLESRRRTEAKIPLIRGRFDMPAEIRRHGSLVGGGLGPQIMRQIARLISGHDADRPKARIDIGDTVREIDVLAHLFTETDPRTLHAINLKQFRDAGDTTKACYQALVSSPMHLESLHGFAPLDASKCMLDFSKSPANYDLPEEFGLPRDKLLRPQAAMFLEMDFTANPGTTIWHWGT